MASRPTESSTDQSSPPSLEELATRGVRAILLPFISGYASPAEPSERQREIVILINPRTRSLSMIEDSVDVEAFVRGKDGRVPASKASIEAMSVVKVAEEGLDCGICLSEFEVGEEAKQMPCKHRYHAVCIDKWLGIQGYCPFCRYRMPEEEEKKNKKGAGGGNGSDGEEEEEEGGSGGIGRRPFFVFHIYFAIHSRSRSNSASASESSDDDNSGSTGDADGSAIQDREVDSGSSSQEMHVDGSIS